MKPILREVPADNGEFSHFELIDKGTGRILWSEESIHRNAEMLESRISDFGPQHVHTLKIHPEYFLKKLAGLSKTEVRVNDRNFNVGDLLILSEFEPSTEVYTGREIDVVVTDLQYLSEFKGTENFVIMTVHLDAVRL